VNICGIRKMVEILKYKREAKTRKIGPGKCSIFSVFSQLLPSSMFTMVNLDLSK
jgi:hypothetical protein